MEINVGDYIDVGDYIEVRNNMEWVSIQKYLFKLGYSWCDNSRKIIPVNNYPYPDYILLEDNHIEKGKHRMFSYSHIPYFDSIVHKAHLILREKKLERILK